MRYIPFVFLLLLVPMVAYADSYERGKDYIKIETVIDGKVFGTWQSAPDWIFDGANYQPYLHMEDSNIIQIETAYGSIILDKNTCGFSIFDKGNIEPDEMPLFTDSIIARMATNGTDSWSEITSINNASCIALWDGTELTAQKQSGAGILEYKYITAQEKWKTQLEATNLSSQTDKKFGFTQTIDINRDTIKFGGIERNLDSYDGNTFDRIFLENNQMNVLNFLNSAYFDFDIAFDNLWAVSVYDTGANKSKLSFDFTRNAPVVLPNETLILDPALQFNATGTALVQESTQSTGSTCSQPGTSVVPDDSAELFYPDNTTNDECNVVSYEWDTTSIDDGATITDVDILIDVDGTSGMSSRTCDITPMTVQPSVVGRSDAHFDDILNGTEYVDSDTFCRTTGTDKPFDLGANADTDVKNNLVNDFYAIGINMDGTVRTGTLSWVNLGNIDITISYTDVVEAITDLSCSYDSNDDSVDCDWTAPAADPTLTGYQILRDVGNGFTTLVNDTGTTTVFYNDTSLTTYSPWHRYDVRGWNPVDLGSQSNIQNVTTLNTPAAVLVTNPAIIGDVSAANYTVSVNGFPNYITIGDITTYINGTQTDSRFFLEPVAAFDFETSVNDLVGTNHGTVTGTTQYGDGVTGDGFDFNGSTRVTLANEGNFDFIDKGNEWSLSFWMRSSDTTQQAFIAKSDSDFNGGPGWYLAAKSSDQQMRFNFADTNDDGIDITFSSSLTDDDVWRHYVITSDGSDLASGILFYEDGTLITGRTVGSDNLSVAGTVTNNVGVTFGGNNLGNRLLTGDIDDVRIYNYTLTPAQVSLLSGTDINFRQTTDWVLLGTTSTEIKHGVTVQYWNGTDQTFNSTATNQVEDFDPTYQPSIITSEGLVNWTTSRINDQDTVLLTVNRDKSGATFQIECLFQTASQAQFANQTGTWRNFTNVGWFNNTVSGFDNSNSYISCYNDNWLFTTISYTNSSLSLAGIQAFDDIYGGFIGVPVGIFFLVLVAGYANPRTAPIWLVVVLAMAGILSLFEIISLGTEIWALMLVAGIMGLFVGRKFF